MRAMESDSLVSAHSMHLPIPRTDDIPAAFDAIAYEKGAAVITMFERWLGPDTFRKGVHRYLEAHRFGSATTDDFLASRTFAAHDNAGAAASGGSKVVRVARQARQPKPKQLDRRGRRDRLEPNEVAQAGEPAVGPDREACPQLVPALRAPVAHAADHTIHLDQALHVRFGRLHHGLFRSKIAEFLVGILLGHGAGLDDGLPFSSKESKNSFRFSWSAYFVLASTSFR